MEANQPLQSRSYHLVQFFNNRDETVNCVSSYVLLGLMAGEGIILIATGNHNRAIEDRLRSFDINTVLAKANGQLLMLDAHETLETFMNGKLPDPDRFHLSVGEVVEKMSKAHPKFRAYGEMVDILSGQGNLDGAIALENLWNDLGRAKRFALLCGYSAGDFETGSEKGRKAKERICDTHTHTLPTWT